MMHRLILKCRLTFRIHISAYDITLTLDKLHSNIGLIIAFSRGSGRFETLFQ